MNRAVTIAMSSLAISLSAGTALSAEVQATDQYPVAIASLDEQFMQQIAQRMFLQLPREHQSKIAHAGGIGSESFADSVLEFHNDAPPLPEVDPDISAHEYLELIVSDELSERMSPEQWNILNAIADTLDEGKTVPHMCFSPDTDREYAYAVNQLIEFPFQVRFQADRALDLDRDRRRRTQPGHPHNADLLVRPRRDIRTKPWHRAGLG